MFKNLTDLSYKRNFLESIEFYVSSFVLGFVLLFILIGLAQTFLAVFLNNIQFSESFKLGFFISRIFGAIYCGFLSFYILRKKQISKHYGAILLFLSSILLALFGAMFVGLVSTAI